MSSGGREVKALHWLVLGSSTKRRLCALTHPDADAAAAKSGGFKVGT